MSVSPVRVVMAGVVLLVISWIGWKVANVAYFDEAAQQGDDLPLVCEVADPHMGQVLHGKDPQAARVGDVTLEAERVLREPAVRDETPDIAPCPGG